MRVLGKHGDLAMRRPSGERVTALKRIVPRAAIAKPLKKHGAEQPAVCALFPLGRIADWRVRGAMPLLTVTWPHATVCAANWLLR